MRLLTPEKIVSVLFYTDKNGKVEPADDGKLLRVEGKEVLLGNDVEVRDVVTFVEIGSGQTKLPPVHRAAVPSARQGFTPRVRDGNGWFSPIPMCQDSCRVEG